MKILKITPGPSTSYFIFLSTDEKEIHNKIFGQTIPQHLKVFRVFSGKEIIL